MYACQLFIQWVISIFFSFLSGFALPSRHNTCEACSPLLAGCTPLSSWFSRDYGSLAIREPLLLSGGPLGEEVLMAPRSSFLSKACSWPVGNSLHTFESQWGRGSAAAIQGGWDSSLCQGQSHLPAAILIPWTRSQIPLYCILQSRVLNRPSSGFIDTFLFLSLAGEQGNLPYLK